MLLCRGSGVTGRCCWTFFGRVWARPGAIGARNVFIQISVRFLLAMAIVLTILAARRPT